MARDELDKIIGKAKKYGACEKINDIKSWKDLVDVFFLPYGLEFLMNTGYPGMDDFRRNKARIATRGIFVDAGDISLSNNMKVGLVGKTTATLKYSGADSLNTIVVMDGAIVNIDASKYAVIKVYNLGGKVNIKKDKTVRIL